MVALAISLVWFWFEKKRVWFGSVVAALKSLKSTAEDASNLEASGLADGCPLEQQASLLIMAPLLEKLAAMHKPLMFWF